MSGRDDVACHPDTAAMYVCGYPKRNDGKTPYTLTLQNVPVDGFWSICVYNEKGFFEKNPQNMYSLNSLTAKPNPDGSFSKICGWVSGTIFELGSSRTSSDPGNDGVPPSPGGRGCPHDRFERAAERRL